MNRSALPERSKCAKWTWWEMLQNTEWGIQYIQNAEYFIADIVNLPFEIAKM